MAEENISLQMTPTTLDGDGLRRNSTGKAVSSNSGEKVVPNYLRSSTGSCHDFCKYGRKHAFEEKSRHPIMKRVASKPKDRRSSVDSVASLGRNKSFAVKTQSQNAPNMTRSLDSLNSLKGGVIAGKKKTSLVKLEADSKSYTYETPKSIKQKVSGSTGKREVSSKKGLTEPKLRNSSSTSSSSLKLKPATGKPKSLGESVGRLNGHGDMKIGKTTGTSQVALKKVQASPAASLSSKPSQGKVASASLKNRSLKKVAPPLKSNNEVRSSEAAEPENDGFQEKTLYVIKMENENNTLELPQNETCAKEEEYVMEMETENNILESDQNETHATEVDFLPHPPSLSPEPSSSPDLLSSSRGEEEEDQQDSEYTTSESEDYTYSENSDAESVDNLEMLDMNNKMHKRPGLDYAEDEDEKAMRLKFRRGKVVEMQPENNAARRLKFRRGRVLDNQDVDADARRRRYKTREEIVDDCTETSAEKVVLKHQDVQGKKDAQGLFNNVIEETASKLVETRKSKVKALVGAFETVISLQDNKPSAANTSQLSGKESSFD